MFKISPPPSALHLARRNESGEGAARIVRYCLQVSKRKELRAGTALGISAGKTGQDALRGLKATIWATSAQV